MASYSLLGELGPCTDVRSVEVPSSCFLGHEDHEGNSEDIENVMGRSFPNDRDSK